MPIYELTESIRDNLRRGLRLHEDGKSGDGLTPKTVREAREGIRDGWDLDKLNRAVAWFARHESSKTPGWDEVGDESPAFVAWLLWGGDPDAVERIRDRARRAEGVDEVRSGPSTSEAMGPEAPAELAADAATLRLYGAIGDYDSSMAAVVGMLDEVDGQDLLVRIASMGGDAFEGIAIANAIMQRKGRTVARIESVAASAASLIAMAADRIEMVEGSLMMIHSASGMVHGEANDMRTAADAIERLNASAAAIYARRSGMTPDEALAAMGRTTWYTADEAVAAGLADAVVRIPMESDAAGAVLSGSAASSIPPAGLIKIAACAAGMTGPAGQNRKETTVDKTTITAEAHAKLQARFDAQAAQLEDSEKQVTTLRAKLEALETERPQLAGKVEALQAQLDAMQERDRIRTRDELIGAAMKAGRINEGQRAKFEALYDAAPEQCADLLASMKAGDGWPSQPLPRDAEIRPAQFATQREYLAEMARLQLSGEARDEKHAADIIEQKYPGTRDAVLSTTRKVG